MRSLLIVIALCLLAGSGAAQFMPIGVAPQQAPLGFGAFTLGDASCANGTSTCTSPSITLQSKRNQLLVFSQHACGDVNCGTAGPSLASWSGTNFNNCVPLTGISSTTAPTAALCSITGTGASTVTANYSGNSWYSQVGAFELTGLGPSPDDGSGTETTGGGSPISVSSTGSTANNNDLLLLLVIAPEHTNVYTAGSGYTILGQTPATGVNWSVMLEYSTINSAGAQAATSTFTTGGTNTFWNGLFFALKPPIPYQPPIISGIALSNGGSFTIPSSNPISTMSATCSRGDCSNATFTLVAAASSSGACSDSSGNSTFTTSGTSLNAVSQINDTTTRNVCLQANVPGAVNFFAQFALTGATGATAGIGPSFTGTTPQPAQMAGLTFLAANYDWGNTSNWTCGTACNENSGKIYNFSLINGGTGVSNWLDCDTFGNGGPSLWHISIQGLPSWNGCAQYAMIQDGGQQVLKMTQNTGCNCLTDMVTQQDAQNGTGPIEFGFGYNYYLEAVYRLDQLTPGGQLCNSGNSDCGPNAPAWVWNYGYSDPVACVGGGTCNRIEDDIGELYADKGGFSSSNWINWAGTFGSDACSGYPCFAYVTNGGQTSYHKYATLVTTNNNGTDIRRCAYLDDVLYNGRCDTVPGGFTTSDTDAIMRGINVIIAQTAAINAPVAWSTLTKYIRMWTCPTNNNGQGRCLGQASTTNGPQGEVFFHQ